MTGRLASERAFKRALIASAVLHTILFIMIFTVPSLPKPAKKGMTYYVNFGGLPGPPGGSGGSGGGGGVRAPAPPPAPTTSLETTPVAPKESLRDLTIPQKATPPAAAETKRYPVEKPKREPAKPAPEKKAVISKPDPGATAAGAAVRGDPAAAGQSGSAGSGLRIGGLGDGPPGSGGGTGGGIGGGGGGTGNFPFAYYLGFIMDKVSANWFTFSAAPRASGLLTVQVFFRIQRNGQISNLRVEQSSGDPTLDMRALRAVQESVPFPPLPNEYEDQYLGVHLVFEHQK